MAARKLATYVHVYDDHGAVTVFGPNDDVPAWAQKKITNPDVWADSDDEPDSAPADPGNSGGIGDGEGAGDSDGQVPPRGGAGSGAEAWRAYAAAKGVEVAADAGRDDVIAALEEAGVPTE